MVRHGLPGVAALKIITKHLKTLLFEVHINLKIKHDKMSAEAKTICHQYNLFLNTNMIFFEDKIVIQIQNTFCSVTSQSETWSRYCVTNEDSQCGP